MKDILKKLGLDAGIAFEKGEEKEKPKGGKQQSSKKDSRKMDDEAKGLVSKMSKIDINKDEREAEAVIKRAM